MPIYAFLIIEGINHSKNVFFAITIIHLLLENVNTPAPLCPRHGDENYKSILFKMTKSVAVDLLGEVL